MALGFIRCIQIFQGGHCQGIVYSLTQFIGQIAMFFDRNQDGFTTMMRTWSSSLCVRSYQTNLWGEFPRFPCWMIFPGRGSFIWRARVVYSGNSNKVKLPKDMIRNLNFYFVSSRTGGLVIRFSLQQPECHAPHRQRKPESQSAVSQGYEHGCINLDPQRIQRHSHRPLNHSQTSGRR